MPHPHLSSPAMARALSYLKYLFTAGNAHGLHSPFVFQLYNEVINDPKHYYAYDKVEALRDRMLLSKEIIETQDFGTGRSHYPVKKNVSFIAKRFVAPRKSSRLLFRLVNHFRPEYILEAGTSLGITTAYLASANSKATVFTLEGCPETARVARTNFRLMRLDNIRSEVGEFDVSLPAALAQMPRLDFAFIDGNHSMKPTLDYAEQCIKKMSPRGLLVIDDIHWSREMEDAWNTLIHDSRVTQSIDLYRMGILFFREGTTKQNFVLRF